MSTRYSGLPDGLPGNDDYGTLSAWYMFAALGFYPQAGSTTYIVHPSNLTAPRRRC
jgi:putative alpha-1,2-mannosidase